MDTEAMREIVGVVGDMRHDGLHAAPHPTVFFPHAQWPTGALEFVARGERDAATALRHCKLPGQDWGPALNQLAAGT